MRSPYPSCFVSTVLTTVLCLAAVPAPSAGAAADSVDRPFVLVADRGDATSWRLLPGAAGAITAEATWGGGASLALILNGPGQTGYFARQDGTSPLVLRFRLTPELLRREGEWRLSVVNFSGRPVRGQVRITTPGAEPAAEVRRRRPDAVIGKMAVAQRVAKPEVVEVVPMQPAEPPPETLPPSGSSGEVRRTVLADGRVRLDYPDGSAKIFEVGCGSTTIHPDGTESKVLCNQVQGAGLPAPPGDPAFHGFLTEHEAGLLQQIRWLVGSDTQAVDHYLALEAGETGSVVERIDLRRRYVDRLLGLGF